MPSDWLQRLSSLILSIINMNCYADSTICVGTVRYFKQNMQRLKSTAIAIAATATLSACGNAFEHITYGKWAEIGGNTPPSLFSGASSKFAIHTTATGKGPVVRAGNLVKLHIKSPKNPEAALLELLSRKRLEGETIWVWTGSASSDSEAELRLGNTKFRSALIGTSAGETLEMTISGNDVYGIELPTFGFLPQQDFYSVRSPYGDWVWPGITVLSSKPKNEIQIDIEIVDVCPARLLRRTAVMKQWGGILNMFGESHPTSREGNLVWFALEGMCSQTTPVRYEIGPLYITSSRDRRELYFWTDSYRRLVSPDEYKDGQTAKRPHRD